MRYKKNNFPLYHIVYIPLYPGLIFCVQLLTDRSFETCRARSSKAMSTKQWHDARSAATGANFQH